MSDVLKSEVIAVDRRLEPRCAVDEERGVGDIVFFVEFAKKPLGEGNRTRRIKPDVQKFVRCGINRRQQSAAFAVQLNHCLVQRNVSR